MGAFYGSVKELDYSHDLQALRGVKTELIVGGAAHYKLQCVRIIFIIFIVKYPFVVFQLLVSSYVEGPLKISFIAEG